ncbi:MAG: YeeE/YedE family protein [Candidatus Rokubacteria bacterium]|nr:YeeE/YedE family protein [Candidatus Rokubacteria bacterium]
MLSATVVRVAGHVDHGIGTPIQWRVVGSAVALLTAGTLWLLPRHGARQAVLLLIGAALGLVLHHAAFGFTRAYRRLVTVGDTSGVRAQLVMLALATVLFAPVLASSGDGSGAIAPASLSVVVGAFIFAIGMQLGGGCGSGTLYHVGAGSTPLLVTLVFFIAGSVIATFHMPFWSGVPSLGELSLGERIGWGPAVTAQLAALAVLAVACRLLDGRAASMRDAPASRVRHIIVTGPWPPVAGGVLLALLNFVTLLVAGHPWTITWGFTLWGGKLVTAVGYDLSAVPFWAGAFQQQALAESVLADTTSVMDLGLILGAFLGAGLAGRFAPARGVPAGRLVASVIGGLLLGYGARIAFGCNIGALVSGVASTSLHGWLWAAAALAGTPVGVRLRRVFALGG